jgi:hypothetical protein
MLTAMESGFWTSEFRKHMLPQISFSQKGDEHDPGTIYHKGLNADNIIRVYMRELFS